MIQRVSSLRNMIFEKLRVAIIMVHLNLLRYASWKSPVPQGYWVAYRAVLGAVFRRANPLFPPLKSFRSTGKTIEIPELRDLLANDILGEWALDAGSIMVIWPLLWRDNPQLILELGAGISTLVLATYAAAASSRGNSCRVVTLEQDQEAKAEVEERLKAVRLDSFVKVFHAPLNDQALYDLNELNTLLSSSCQRIDWVLIDGPSGPPGCWFGTLPNLVKFCRCGARWFLDDAFRDGELKILKRWRCLPNINVEGIFPIGKGLATGRVS